MKKEQIKDLLGEEIKTEIQGLSALAPGSKEKSTAIDDLTKLYRLKIEETKTELDFDEKRERRVMENEQYAQDVAIKKLQHSEENLNRVDDLEERTKDRYFRLGIAAAEIILPLVFYATWMKKGFKFEETGTYTSQTFKGLFNRFKPTKR